MKIRLKTLNAAGAAWEPDSRAAEEDGVESEDEEALEVGPGAEGEEAVCDRRGTRGECGRDDVREWA